MFRRSFRIRNIVGIVLIVLLMVVAGAFAAANVVPESGAGDGTGAISGYTVTNVNYTLGSSDPYYVTDVDFDVNATAGAGDPTTVYAELDGNSVLCTGTAPSFSCDFSAANVTAAAAATLRVVAAQ